ncbi:class I SAM-dependent methyltransferase [Polaromonas sp. P2-4]|nr:class I SAM-dependent methyltransferase [Polaromonas sp. P2-4]
MTYFNRGGISGLLRATHSRVRGLLARRSKSILTYKNQFVGKSGIEIGGPSQVFSRRGIFPVYPIVESLDNCNFQATTVWEESINQGRTYRFDPKKPAGQQHIVEATALAELPSGAYDFVLSSHMLEHTANPILALSECKRLLTDDGILVLLLPNRTHTFDHRRPVTTMDHLIADFNAGMTEDDLTHLPEILALHDLERDPEAGDMVTFKSRSMRNFENRCIHHHVFDKHLAVDLVEYIGLKVHAVEEINPHHILLLASWGLTRQCLESHGCHHDGNPPPRTTYSNAYAGKPQTRN